MPIYRLTHKHIILRILAPCQSCARSEAVNHAKEEGTAVWRNPSMSSCTVEHATATGPRMLLERIENA